MIARSYYETTPVVQDGGSDTIWRFYRMTDNNGNGLGIVIFGIIAILILGFVAHMLIGAFDVPWDVALKSAISLIGWVVGLGILFFVIYHNDDWLWAAPPFVGLIIPVFNPILKHIAGVREYSHFQPKIEWYGETWILFLIYLAFNAVAYFAIYRWKDRY